MTTLLENHLRECFIIYFPLLCKLPIGRLFTWGIGELYVAYLPVRGRIKEAAREIL